MKRFWIDIARHRATAVLFAAYWLASLVVTRFTWDEGIPGAVVALLFSNCLLGGALISWWRSQSIDSIDTPVRRIAAGMVAGVFVGEITFLLVKGGVADEFIGWMRGLPHFGQWDEVIGLALVTGFIGAMLGSIGAALPALYHDRMRPS